MSSKRPLNIDELNANHYTVSVHKYGFILPVFTKWFKVIIDDKNRMEESVKKSRLEWTIVRCTTVNHRPATGKV